MENLNIPKFRARLKNQKHQHETDSVKLIDGIWYIVGFYANGYITGDTNDRGILRNNFDCQQIDKSTLAINFPGMLDSEDNPIFASLSEDGMGGDCTHMDNGYNEVFCWDTLNACVVLKSPNYERRLFKEHNSKRTALSNLKIIGIQK